ncbi:MAG: GNAT family N-acetyltransferase [Paracoccaceae bacterium]|nr:GNAT family N-acetyltransferase [Paracoccaceae bacterium]
MRLQTRIANPSSKEGIKLLTDSYALMSTLFPPEDNHALSIEDFKAPNIYFIIAYKDDKPCGCGALATKSNYGELKSIFVDEKSRRLGIGELIMMDLEVKAKNLKLNELYLETGANLLAAIKLYRKLGFIECSPFGDYKESPHSFFMFKKLD